MAYRNLLLSFEGRVAVLTVNRPEVRNALDGATVGELHRALGEVRTARSTVLIVTGAGEKAFVSGADIRSLRDRRRDDALASMNSRLMTEVESHDAVVIAAVNGVALGGGCELALADRVLALGPLAVRLSKMALNASGQMPLSAGLLYESTAQAITFESADKQEGTTAFLEKRKPVFKG